MAFKELGTFETTTEAKKKIADALDIVSRNLGNTKNVCKKYYVHPVILSLYESKSLDKYIDELDEIEKKDERSDLTSAEKVVMRMLEKN